MKLVISAVITILMLMLCACAGDSPAGQFNLDNTSWLLTTYNGNPPIAGTQPTIQFMDGQVSGTTGCNHYGGGYQVSGSELRFDALFMTEMACMEPEGVMEQERDYLEMLGAAERFQVDDGVLTIFTSTQQALIFSMQ